MMTLVVSNNGFEVDKNSIRETCKKNDGELGQDETSGSRETWAVFRPILSMN